MVHEPVVMSYLIQRDGNCLFRAVLYYMKYNTEYRHSEIRLNTVNKIINEWKYYKDLILYLSKVDSAVHYKYSFSRDREYGISIKFSYISHLFPNY